MKQYLLYLLVPIALFAEDNYVGVSLGYSLEDSDKSANGTSNYFLRVGQSFSENIISGVEFTYGSLDAKEDCCTDVNTKLFGVNVLWDFFEYEKSKGYLITGLGYQNVKKPMIEYDIDVETDKYQDSGVATFGVGTKYHVSEYIDLRAEVVAYTPFDGSKTHVLAQFGIDIPFNQKTNILTNNRQPSTINILFESGKSDLNPIFYSELDKFVHFLRKHPESQMDVLGHTDNIASNNYNLLLSKKRANAVKEYIVSQGISSSKVKAMGVGETYPIATNNTKDGRKLNRRIEAKIYR